jgi:MazG family protein
MAALRNPEGGCPWDLEQDFASIAPYTIEEAYEVADAIQREDFLSLKDELGDLLLQVVYHARMAEEAGHFDFGDVVGAICDKMIRRHPHVFGDAEVADAQAQTRAWEDLKAAERDQNHQDAGLLDQVPTTLPALTRAAKLGRRASRVGFDWPSVAGPWAKVQEELGELDAAMAASERESIAAEMGDVLFALVNVCRHLDLDPEDCLRGTNGRFVDRFQTVESFVESEAGGDWTGLDLGALEALWQRAKAQAG